MAMKQFHYRGYDKQGNSLEGTLAAENESDAKSQIAEQVDIVVELKQSVSQVQIIDPAKLTLSLEDKELFFSELALLLNNGITLVKSLTILTAAMQGKSQLQSCITYILGELEGGSSFSSALEKFEKAFDSITVGLIKVSENTGEMPRILTDLAAYYRFSLDNKRKIIQSITYPAIVFGICLLAVYVILDFVIPNMSSIFSNNQNIPGYTQLILDLSNGFQTNKLVILSGLAFGSALLYIDVQRNALNSVLMKTLTKIPAVNRILFELETIRFSSTMQLTLSAGMTINQAITLATEVVSTKLMRDKLKFVEEKVSSGGKFSETLKSTGLFDAMYLGLVEVGEESGKMDEVFAQLTLRTREEMEARITRLTTLLEPMLILFLGGFVGGIVVIMILSIMSGQDLAI